MLIYCIADNSRQEAIGCALDLDNAKRIGQEHASRHGVYPDWHDDFGESRVDVNNQSIVVYGWQKIYALWCSSVWELLLFNTKAGQVFGTGIVISEFNVDQPS